MFGMLFYYIFEVLFYCFEVVFQDIVDLIDFFIVGFFVFQCFVGAYVVFDVVFQVNFEFVCFDIFSGQVIVIGFQGKQLFDEFEDDFQLFFVGVRAEVGGIILDYFLGNEYLGELFFFNVDVRVVFVVLQYYIVLGLMFFDEGVFQQKGICFGFYYGEFNVVGIFYYYVGVVGVVFVLFEVRRDLVVQVFGFVYI